MAKTSITERTRAFSCTRKLPSVTYHSKKHKYIFII